VKKSDKKESIDELVTEFAEGTLQQNDEIRRGVSGEKDEGNDRRVRAFSQLTSHYGDSGRDALKSLFGHSDHRVRVVAASYLLRHCTEEAMAVLREEAEHGSGLAEMGAYYSIKNWNEGKWHLDP